MAQLSTAFPFVAGALSASVTIAVLLRHQFYSRRVRLPFAVLTLSCAIWSTAYGFQLMATSLETKLLWFRLWWTVAAFTPTLWFVFSLAYVGDNGLLSRRSVAALCVEPVLVVLLVFTGTAGTNDLFLSDFFLHSHDSATHLVAAHGPLYGAHLLYVGILSVGGLVVMGGLLVRGDGSYRRGTIVLLSAASIPLLTFSMRVLGLSMRIDATPIALGLSSLVVLFGLRSDDLFDARPVARDRALSQMRDGIVVLDDRGRVVELNPAALPLFTVSREEAVGSHVADVCHNSLGMYALLDADRDRLDLTIEDDGENRYYEATATRLDGDGGGHERGWTLVLRDITERRRAEAKYRALIESSRDLINIVDEDGSRKYVSPASEHVLGIPPSEMQGDEGFDRVHPDDHDRARQLFEDVLESDEPVRAEMRVKHADGSWRILDSLAVNSLDDPAIDGIVVNSRDVTHRHRYQQRLRVLNRILRHDLRNDMNVVLGHANLLSDIVEDEEKQAHVRTIRRKAQSLVSLGERAREIDRTLHGGRERHPVEITNVVREKLETIRDLHPSVVVNTHLPDEEWVLATPHVGTAVTNVVDNALEHNDRVLPRVGISVSHRPDDDEVEVRVVDNGPGIPASELSPLQSGLETQLEHASGLGLWLVKWILTGSHASLDFEERHGRGTAVVMRFEAAAAPRDGDGDSDDSRDEEGESDADPDAGDGRRADDEPSAEAGDTDDAASADGSPPITGPDTDFPDPGRLPSERLE